MQILGIDYGEKIIGLAISDPSGIIAHGHGVIEHITLATDLEQLRDIIQTEKIEQIVIGLPKKLDNTLGAKAKEVMEFVEELKQYTDVPIVFWDERLTSVEAGRSIREMHLKRAQRKRHVNTVAACIILQSYLDASRVNPVSSDVQEDHDPV